MDMKSSPKPKKSTPSKKTSKLSGNSGYVDDDEALMKAITLSLQDSPGFLDVANKTPPQSSGANASSAETTERKQSVQKDDLGKRKRKNMSWPVFWHIIREDGVQRSIALRSQRPWCTKLSWIHRTDTFFAETGKGGINLRDLWRVAASHDFTWKDEEMEHVIQFFDSNEDGKLSLEDFSN
ncbi:calmodulin-related protein [Artemisia annua]|uniref:Calmodulin-related protein n=1 Tax=Artemisia annua TaxID=35608 RepID=A0A2U1M134_ARTAN|nr:calmodulin-related protein [Artemisia annua]